MLQKNEQRRDCCGGVSRTKEWRDQRGSVLSCYRPSTKRRDILRRGSEEDTSQCTGGRVESFLGDGAKHVSVVGVILGTLVVWGCVLCAVYIARGRHTRLPLPLLLVPRTSLRRPFPSSGETCCMHPPHVFSSLVFFHFSALLYDMYFFFFFYKCLMFVHSSVWLLKCIPFFFFFSRLCDLTLLSMQKP